MRPQPLIAVRDVEASSRWYQRLLGGRSDHGGTEYERLVDGGRLILQLHAWDIDHDHGAIGDAAKPYGNGVLLWFEIDDFDGAVARRPSSAPRSCCRRTATRPTASPAAGPPRVLAARPRRLHRGAGQPRRRIAPPGRLDSHRQLRTRQARRRPDRTPRL